VCVCVYVYMYVYIHVCIYTYTYIAIRKFRFRIPDRKVAPRYVRDSILLNEITEMEPDMFDDTINKKLVYLDGI